MTLENLIIIFLIIILSILFVTIKKLKKSNNIIPNKNKQIKTEYKYNKRPLLTTNELNFYKSLLIIANSKHLVVCPKVRLADLLDHKIKGQNFQGAFAKIQSKHIDFVLCKPIDMMPLIAIELDDSSHDKADRKERDLFVDSALNCAGIPILHTRSTESLAEKINKLAFATSTK